MLKTQARQAWPMEGQSAASFFLNFPSDPKVSPGLSSTVLRYAEPVGCSGPRVTGWLVGTGGPLNVLCNPLPIFKGRVELGRPI